jgi:hypothetical protein
VQERFTKEKKMGAWDKVLIGLGIELLYASIPIGSWIITKQTKK